MAWLSSQQQISWTKHTSTYGNVSHIFLSSRSGKPNIGSNSERRAYPNWTHHAHEDIFKLNWLCRRLSVGCWSISMFPFFSRSKTMIQISLIHWRDALNAKSHIISDDECKRKRTHSSFQLGAQQQQSRQRQWRRPNGKIHNLIFCRRCVSHTKTIFRLEARERVSACVS